MEERKKWRMRKRLKEDSNKYRYMHTYFILSFLKIIIYIIQLVIDDVA